MLSKWLLISLLGLGVQKISAGNYIDKPIDLGKFSIFYDPNTYLTPKGVLENVGRDPFPGVGFRGMKCNCEGLTCGCCTGINIIRFNIDQHACTNFTFYPEDFGLKLKLLINKKEILSTGLISGKNPPPLCMPFYPPLISLCVRVFDVYVSGRNLHACIDLEAHVVSWPILIVHFDCVKIGADGISWMKPEDSNVTHTVELTEIKPQVNGPEIYDQVNFEPDSVNIPNNNTSNITPEEEDNIGQLKL